MAGKLNLIFSHKFDMPIWKYRISNSGDYFAFELRAENSDELKFLSLDMKEAKVEEIKLKKDDWWTTLYDVDELVVYFKRYDSGANPVILSVIRWNSDTKSEELLPGDTNITFKKNSLVTPSFYTPENEHYTLLSRFIGNIVDHEPNKSGIEYLEWNNYISLSYYTGVKNMANFLLTVNDTKEAVHHICLAENLTGIGQDTFSVDNNKLIFVKDNCEIFIYQHG
ncbi:MAG: hypothetical protein RLO81_18470 [Fulvivirga sp.]|uniref:hypothetical protein n=1 Tax=Fulvivirga sp. TaxID=1931237 RepID=UPI0032EADB90